MHSCIINAKHFINAMCMFDAIFFFFLFKKIKAVSFYNKLNIDFPSFLNKSFNFSSNRVCGESSTVFWSVSSSRFDSLHLLVFWAGAELNLLTYIIFAFPCVFFSLNIIVLFQWFMKRFGILYKTFFLYKCPFNTFRQITEGRLKLQMNKTIELFNINICFMFYEYVLRLDRWQYRWQSCQSLVQYIL